MISVYEQSIALSEAMGELGGFPVVHVWQPDLYSKAELDPGELALFEGLALDEERFAAMDALFDQVRAALPEQTVDLGGAFDDVEGPVLADYVHTNEVGARAVAEAMYAELRPQLEALAAEQAGGGSGEG